MFSKIKRRKKILKNNSKKKTQPSSPSCALAKDKAKDQGILPFVQLSRPEMRW